MLNFLRSNQPFYFIVSVLAILTLSLCFQYFNYDLSSYIIPFKIFAKVPLVVNYLLLTSLIFFTSFKINSVVNKSVLFPKSFYLPGFLYLLFMTFYAPVSYLFFPAISNLLIVMAMGEFFQIYRNESCKNKIFKANLYLFLSTLFSPFNVLLVPISWIVLFIIRPFEIREYIMPLIVLLLFSLYIVPFGLINGQLNSWIYSWWSSLTNYTTLPSKLLLTNYIMFFSVGFIFSINPISSTFISSNNRYKKIIWVIISLLFFSLLISVISGFSFKPHIPYLYPFFIPICIIISNGMIRSRVKWVIDIFLFLFIIFTIVTNII